MHWVMADLHGCFSEFMRLKSTIEKNDHAAQIIIAGDILDRGKETAELLTWCMENANRTDGKYILLMGNHEELIIDWYDVDYYLWLTQGQMKTEFFPETMFDFDEVIKKNHWMSKEILEPKIEFLRNLPLYYIVETKDMRFLIAHAWLPKKEIMDEIIAGKAITDSQKSIFLWERRINEAYSDHDVCLVHGHTPTLNTSPRKKAKVEFYANTINVDCGCNFKEQGGRMAAVCLETGKVLY